VSQAGYGPGDGTTFSFLAAHFGWPNFFKQIIKWVATSFFRKDVFWIAQISKGYECLEVCFNKFLHNFVRLSLAFPEIFLQRLGLRKLYLFLYCAAFKRSFQESISADTLFRKAGSFSRCWCCSNLALCFSKNVSHPKTLFTFGFVKDRIC